MDKVLYNVFFSGGLDSTYRLCQLALDDNAIIQPIYILFPDDGHPHVRPEMNREIEAQDKILKYIQSKPQTKAEFLPVKRVHRNDIPKYQGDDSLFGRGSFFNWLEQLSRGGMGWQYYYFALYSHWVHGVELCQERFRERFTKNKLEFYIDDVGRRRLKVDDSLGKSKVFYEFLFKNFSFPIEGITREQMLSDLRNWGYYDVLHMIFFCYRSADGSPCGVCDNCYQKIEQGLTFLFNKEALHNYYVYKVLKSFFDIRISTFFSLYIVYGEENFFKLCYEEILNNNSNMKDLLISHIDILKKLYYLSDFRLKRLIRKCHNEQDVYSKI